MQYVVSRATGNDRNVLMALGCGKTEVTVAATKNTGLLDPDGNPILRVAQARQKMGFHIPTA